MRLSRLNLGNMISKRQEQVITVRPDVLKNASRGLYERTAQRVRQLDKLMFGSLGVSVIAGISPILAIDAAMYVNGPQAQLTPDVLAGAAIGFASGLAVAAYAKLSKMFAENEMKNTATFMRNLDSAAKAFTPNATQYDKSNYEKLSVQDDKGQELPVRFDDSFAMS